MQLREYIQIMTETFWENSKGIEVVVGHGSVNRVILAIVVILVSFEKTYIKYHFLSALLRHPLPPLKFW